MLLYAIKTSIECYVSSQQRGYNIHKNTEQMLKEINSSKITSRK